MFWETGNITDPHTPSSLFYRCFPRMQRRSNIVTKSSLSAAVPINLFVRISKMKCYHVVLWGRSLHVSWYVSLMSETLSNFYNWSIKVCCKAQSAAPCTGSFVYTTGLMITYRHVYKAYHAHHHKENNIIDSWLIITLGLRQIVQTTFKM